jgi:hypothetical protein
MEMFLRQAAAQFECFVNRPAPVELMRAALRRAMSPVQHLDGPPAEGDAHA